MIKTDLRNQIALEFPYDYFCAIYKTFTPIMYCHRNLKLVSGTPLETISLLYYTSEGQTNTCLGDAHFLLELFCNIANCPFGSSGRTSSAVLLLLTCHSVPSQLLLGSFYSVSIHICAPLLVLFLLQNVLLLRLKHHKRSSCRYRSHSHLREYPS